LRVVTARGTMKTRDVVVATNGYTSRLTPWLQRRVIPSAAHDRHGTAAIR
jgi:glycine/D-amino acid oxidase-like deaminating enzyme